MPERIHQSKFRASAARLRRAFLLGAALCLGGGPAAAVEETRLLAAHEDAANWLTYGHGYANQRYSGLDQIRVDNVGRLVPKWIYQTGVLGTFPTSPIVADGVMYLSTPYNHVVALDAATGRQRWRYTHSMAVDTLCCGSHNRGVALGYGRLYMITADARLLALDAADGTVVWDLPVVDPMSGAPADVSPLIGLTAEAASSPERRAELDALTRFAGNMTPVVYDGKVFVGVSGTGYSGVLSEAEAADASVLGRRGPRRGLRAFVSAHDVATGALVWRWYATAAQGWEGAFVERTSFGDVLDRDVAAERANAEKYRDAWKTGGGSIYSSPSIDPELGLLYFGTGNASPGYDDATRPGDNLYTASVVALDVQSGELRWYHQLVPHDIWGYDVASPPVLFDLPADAHPADGRLRAVGVASKSGWLHIFDRETGRAIRRSEAFVPQNEFLFRRPTPDGVLIAPGAAGGANWPPSSYHPGTGWIYVAGTHTPTRYRLEPGAAGRASRVEMSFDDSVDRWGTLSAIDPGDGKIEWQVKTDLPLVSGSLATAGGLVLYGESDGDFVARDARDGTGLWRFHTGAGVNAPPVTYTVSGKQYVAVAAGGHRLFKFPLGNAVVAFGLPDPPSQAPARRP